MAGTSIAFAPLLPWPVLAALGAVAAGLMAFSLWRGARGTLVRAAALAALLLALANPSLVEELRDPLKDVAVMLVDRTPSQHAGERLQRTDAAVAEIEAAAQAFADDLELRVVTIDHRTVAAAAEGTRAFSALEKALTDVPSRRIAGTIMVTDGQVHDAPTIPENRTPDAEAEAVLPPGPLHVLLTGDRDEGDRRLIVVEAPSYGIVGRPIDMTIRVEDAGSGPGGTALVTVRRDGTDEQRFPVPVGRDHRIAWSLQHAGQTVFELEVDEGPRELTLENNRAAVSVNGVRDRLRVLLVSGEPHSGERVWRNLLKSDPSVDLIHFTILRPPEKQDGTPINELSLISFPTRELFELKLQEFDLVIFDRYRRRGVLPMAYFGNVVEYVNNGGALLEASGPAFASSYSLYRTPLGDVLPGEPTGAVMEGGFRAALTEVGRRHPVTASLPGSADAPDGTAAWGRWFRQIDVDTKRGRVVMTGAENRPLLILDRVGEGRVAQLNSDHIWLWARGFEGGGPQAELLRRVAHWLMREPDLEENDLRMAVVGGALEIMRRDVDGENRPVTLTAPDGSVTELALEERQEGEFRIELPVEQAGLYRVDDGSRVALAAAGALNSLEMADIRTTDAILRPVAAATGGSVHWLADGTPALRRVGQDRSTAGRDWVGLVRNDDYVLLGVAETPLLPPLLLAALILGAIAFAWHREAR